MNRIQRAGASRSGLIEWLAQRLTAVYMALFLVYALPFVTGNVDYQQWRQWFDSGVVRWGWTLFYLGMLWHSWIGLRSIFLDYIKPFWLRLVLTLASGIGLSLLALWMMDILYIRAAGGAV